MLTQTIEKITPELARKYLQNGIVNRNLSKSTVSSYAADMIHGDWRLNGESIKFDENGNLVDGNHRLNAIIEAGIPVEMVVVRGVPVGDSDIYDRGRGRTVRDTLAIKEYPKNIVSRGPAIVRLYFDIEKNNLKPSDSQIKGFIDSNIELLEQVLSITGTHDGTVRVSGAWFQYPLLCALSNGEPLDRLRQFSNAVRTGYINDNEKDLSAITLRNDILNEKVYVKGGHVERRKSVICVENALYDFCRQKGKKRTYSMSEKRRYEFKPKEAETKAS